MGSVVERGPRRRGGAAARWRDERICGGNSTAQSRVTAQVLGAHQYKHIQSFFSINNIMNFDFDKH